MLKVYELGAHATLPDGTTPHVFLDGEMVLAETAVHGGPLRWLLTDGQVEAARRNGLAPRLVAIRPDPPAAPKAEPAPVAEHAAAVLAAHDDLPPGEHLRRVFAEPQAPEPGDGSDEPVV